MSDDRIFNSDELYAPINLRKDIEADNIFFQRLLAHPSIKVERFYPSPDSLFEYIGSVTIGGQSIPLTFDHKGEGKGSNPSALKARINLDDDTRTLIRQVIIENAPALRGRATKKPVERQPGTLQIRVTPTVQGRRKARVNLTADKAWATLGKRDSQNGGLKNALNSPSFGSMRENRTRACRMTS
ncbi:hypothetical protein [Deinococcus wulumuqiensis]|uniref:hypothetical protein n=1 Tax=Deinococcus wulumuqiensis TaxID=980427 RepID=UPI0035E756F4